MDCALDAQVMVTIGRAEAGDVRKLRQLAKCYGGRLRLIEWSDEMPMLLRAADVVVGKPGGLSVAEALACGRPFFATTSLGGQEGFNLQFLEQHGVGRQVALEELFDALYGLLSSPRKLIRAQDQAWKLGRRDGAEQIAALAVTHARPRGEAGKQWAAQTL